MDYCSCVWGSGNVEKLYKLQKRAARMIYDLPSSAHSEPLFKRLNWMTIMDRINYRRAVMVYKSLNGLAPSYMKDMYTLVNNVNTRSTRYCDNLRIYLAPKANLKLFTNSFQYQSADIWNNLPLAIRDTATLNQFKGAYCKWFYSQR